jgi:hypothetical protein
MMVYIVDIWRFMSTADVNGDRFPLAVIIAFLMWLLPNPMILSDPSESPKTAIRRSGFWADRLRIHIATDRYQSERNAA